VFDPENVTDNSTYRKGTLPSTGFKAVLVSGNLVLEDDKALLETTAGKPIRFAPIVP
jgi:N-acyl-D-aspartate/D-glutamate deacylase